MTVMPAVAFGKPTALAVIVVEPAETALTGTETAAELGANATVAGTVATFGSAEFRLTARPLADAGTVRLRVRFWAPVPLMVRLGGEKLMVTGDAPLEVTWTCWLEEPNP